MVAVTYDLNIKTRIPDYWYSQSYVLRILRIIIRFYTVKRASHRHFPSLKSPPPAVNVPYKYLRSYGLPR